MKLLLLLIPLLLSAVSNQQLQVLKLAHHIGSQLIIDDESYGNTLAALTLTESSAGIHRFNPTDPSYGVCQFTIPRARELLATSVFYAGLRSLPDNELAVMLQYDDQLNLVLAGINLKLNLARWNGSYTRAIRSHNGYAPSRRIYNQAYYDRFTTNLRLVKSLNLR